MATQADPIRRRYLRPAVLGLILVASSVIFTACDSPFARMKLPFVSDAASNAAIPAPTSTINPNAQPLSVLSQADWPIPGGHFYTQTNGQPSLASPTGFSVTNADEVPIFDEYQRLGGPAGLGYPVSSRFSLGGRLAQAFERGALGWNAQGKKVEPINTILVLEAAGKGDWLNNTQNVPAGLPSDFDANKPWDRVVADRMNLLKANPAIEAKYHTASDPLALYGLPDSRIVESGDHFALRTQRVVLRQWKSDTPTARANEVTVDSVGGYLVSAGIVPQEAGRTGVGPNSPQKLSLEGQAPGSVQTPTALPSASTIGQPAPASPPPGAATPAPAQKPGATSTPRAGTPVAMPTPNATPGSNLKIGNTGGDGVFLRWAPKLDAKVRPYSDGTPLKRLGEQAQGDGQTWIKVQAPDGQVGWIPAQYAQPG